MNNQANLALLELKKEFKAGDNKEYKVEAIVNSIVYGHEIENHLLDSYYLVL